MKKIDIEEINFHDNYIKSIYIDRNDPGKNDTIVMIIETGDSVQYLINFKETYQIKLYIPMGFYGQEYINWTKLSKDDEDLLLFLDKLKTVGIEIPDLKCFEIDLNVNAGQIKIFSKEIEVIKSLL